MSVTDDKSKSEKKDFDKEQIDRLINKIILKNREKLEANNESHRNTDHFTRVLEEKKGIYYLKDSDKKKHKHETISGKIINDARENLGKDPLKIDVSESDNSKFDKSNLKEKDKKPKKKKLRIVFGKKDKKSPKLELLSIEQKTSEEKTDINKTNGVVKGEDYTEVISEIENHVDTIKPKEQILPQDKSIQEDTKQTNEKTFSRDEVIKKDTKQPTQEKPVKNIQKNVESKKEKIDFSGNITRIEPRENKFFGKKANEFLKETEKKENNIFESTRNKEKGEGLSSKPHSTKLKFRVENLPDTSDKEKKLVDEKIKESSERNKDDEGKSDLDEAAKNLAKKHLDNKEDDSAQKSNMGDLVGSESEDGPKKQDKGSEHVFFDEDVSFDGWSPHATDKEKNALFSGSDTELQKDLKDGRIGEVKNVELPRDALSVDSVKLSDLGFSESEWQELDFYPLYEPFAYVEILREKETLEKRYFLVEVDLTKGEQEILDFIFETIFNINIETEDMESFGEEDYLAKKIQDVVKEYHLDIDEDSLKKILYHLSKDSLGLGKIDPLMKDPNIEDISCDGSRVPLFLYHRKYGSLKSNIHFKSEDQLNSFVVKLAQKCGKHISIAEPMLDATMPDGSRVQMTLSDVITAHGSTFTIRKFRSDPFSPPDLIEFNTMSSEMISYMWLAVENGINMLFAGGTASGKTSTLNALSLFIPPESKIVSIEETREINLPHPNWIPGVSRSGFGEVVADKTIGEIDMYDLMKAALRQRPEYILVGEIRGKEAYVLFQAMATGHSTYSTVHADSAQSLIHRLEGKPINIPRVMLQSLDVVALNVITRVNNKRARRCKQVIEIIDIDPNTKEILTNEVFRWDPVEDKFVYSGKSYVLERIRAEKDYSRDSMTKEIKDRMKIIEYMNDRNIRGFREVAQLVSRYLDNPKEVMSKIKKDEKS